MVHTASIIRFYAGGMEVVSATEGLFESALVIAVVTSVTLLSTGLYEGRLREGMPGVLIRVAISLVMSMAVVGLLFYLLPQLSLWRGVIFLSYGLTFFVIGTIRVVFFELVDISTFKSHVLVYGAGNGAAYIDKKMRRKSDRRGFEVKGYVPIDDQKCEIDTQKLVNIDSTLYEYVVENQINEIIVATSNSHSEMKLHELVECKLNGISVLDILTFFEREAGQVRIDIIDPSWLVTSDGFRHSRFQNVIKRIFDLLVSSALLVVTLPIQLLVIAAIWVEDGFGPPIIYRQTRAGVNGKSFNVYKFRSMVSDAEKSGKAVWACEGDSRITRVGEFLRKYRLDELPQAVNVIKGEMSFVGPRPERPEFVEELAKHIPYYNERHILKPGLTGWAQLNYPYGSSLEDAYQKQIYDLYYVKNHSLFLDCLILLQTVEVVLFGKGAR